MKKHIFLHIFCVFCLIFCYFCFPQKILVANSDDFYYTDNIHHLFTHCLIAYPEIAFDKNNSMQKHFANDCITAKEFYNILNYDCLFILVNRLFCIFYILFIIYSAKEILNVYGMAASEGKPRV